MLRIHPDVERQCDCRFFDTQEKIQSLFQICYPSFRANSSSVCQTERTAILILKTGCTPHGTKQSLTIFCRNIREINRFRIEHNISLIPEGLAQVEIRRLLPEYDFSSLDVEPSEGYEERLEEYYACIRRKQLEIDVIRWITSGNIPVMTTEEKE